MSFYSEVEEFFENESTDCDYCLREYDADDMGRRYAEYLRLFKLQPGDKAHLEFLCSEIESHISRGKTGTAKSSRNGDFLNIITT